MIQNPPRRYSQFDFVKRTRTDVFDYRGSQVIEQRPERVPCDYCMTAVDRLWCWLVRPVGAEVAPRKHYVYDGGYWRACVFCRPFVDHDAELLAVRVATLHPEYPPAMIAVLPIVWRSIWSARTGPEVEWRAGQMLPTLVGEFGGSEEER